MKEKIHPNPPLKKEGTNRWRVYTRGTIHPHRFSIALIGHVKYSAQLTGQKLARVLYYNQGSKFWFAWREEDLRRFGNSTFKKLINSGARDKYFKKLDHYAQKAIKSSELIFKKSLLKYSDRELLSLYDSVFKPSALAHGLFNVDIDIFDAVFDDFLRKQIFDEMPKNEEIFKREEVFKELARPIYQTYVLVEEKEVIRAALKLKISQKDIDKLFKKYWWINLGWENMKPHKKEYFKNLTLDWKKNKNFKERLEQIDNSIKELKSKRIALFKKYNFSSKINYWLEFLDEYARYHDVRKEMQVKTVFALYLIMQEIARRLDLKPDDLEWLWDWELRDLLKDKKLNIEEIEKRKKAVWALVDSKKVELLSGDKAIRRFKQEIIIEDKEVKKFSGFCASAGKAQGKAKICIGIDEARSKIKRGDILVCGMTTPDYVPIMRKCAAIVTDEGGLTCHAAIVSRELHKPCIVGTKIATQVLKDEDLVEVDANKGVVRILKNHG